jgi:hypothetical protein
VTGTPGPGRARGVAGIPVRHRPNVSLNLIGVLLIAGGIGTTVYGVTDHQRLCPARRRARTGVHAGVGLWNTRTEESCNLQACTIPQIG